MIHHHRHLQEFDIVHAGILILQTVNPLSTVPRKICEFKTAVRRHRKRVISNYNTSHLFFREEPVCITAGTLTSLRISVVSVSRSQPLPSNNFPIPPFIIHAIIQHVINIKATKQMNKQTKGCAMHIIIIFFISQKE